MPADEDFFSAYFDYVAGESGTEAPWIFHRWACITGIAALLGRSMFIRHGHNTIYPNFYTMLIGGPGTRKGSAIKPIKNLLSLADYGTFAASKTSKEQFLQDLGNGFDYGKELKEGEGGINGHDFLDELLEKDFIDKTPKEVFICADEFTDFIGSNNTEFISLLGNLWDNLPKYDHRIKTGKSIYIHEPTVNILSGNTPTGFANAFPPAIVGQGMLSRLLLVYSEGTGIKITWPDEPQEEDTLRLAAMLKMKKLKYTGALKVTPEAKDVLDKIYKGWENIDDARLSNYSNRRFTHLLKLCMVVVVGTGREFLDKDGVIYSNSILSFAEHRMPAALGEFGKSKNADVAGKVLQLIDDARKPMKLMEIWRLVHNDLEEIKHLIQIIMNLNQAGKLQKVDDGYLVKKAVRRMDTSLVDFNLLKEGSGK